MTDNVTLYWHPAFGAVLAIETGSGVDIADVLNDCAFTPGLTAKDVRFVRPRRFLRIRRFIRRICS